MLKVLIVDDSASFRGTLRDLLRQQVPQVLVVEAADAREALEQLGRTTPDLAFIDIELGTGSGLDLTRKIRIRHPDIPIAIITNYDLPEYRLAARDSGASSFFSKISSSVEDLLAWVASASPDIRIP
jgi:DNA-binding NarL/FixJ family response regulator